MGVSLVSSVRFNHRPIPPVWKDVVFGYRTMSPEEVAAYGRLSGHHKTGTEFTTFTAEPAKSVTRRQSEIQSGNYFQISSSANDTV